MGENVRDTSSGNQDRVLQMEAIVAEYETGLLRYATRILRDATTAEDVVQNAFIKLFRLWEAGTRPTDKLKGWLYRVTHNEAVDYIRRESRLRVLHDKDAEENEKHCPDGRHCPAVGDERHAQVLDHLDGLKPREQQVVLLRLEEGLSYKEISEIMGRSVGNIGNILHHAVKRLSDILKREGIIEARGVEKAGVGYNEM